MHRKDRSPMVLMLMAALVGLFTAGFFSGCSSPAKSPLNALFDEGKTIFYNAVADEVSHHPKRGQLNAAELTKIRELQAAYPRLYAILMNYYYQKDAPVFKALLEQGSEDSMRRFRKMYVSWPVSAPTCSRRASSSPARQGPILRILSPGLRTRTPWTSWPCPPGTSPD